MVMLMFLLFVYFFCTFLLVFLNHPLSLALNLFFQTLFIGFLLTISISSPWFSYILFLVFLGGLLVIFAYVSTFASNEKFSITVSNLLGALMVTSVVFLVVGVSFTTVDSVSFNFQDLLSFDFISVSMYSLNPGLVGFLVLYLLFSLIVVVRLNRMTDGPLRSF